METNWGTLIKEIGRGAHGARDLGEEHAYCMFAATGEDALLMRGSEGEPYANPRRQPQIELLRGGKCSVLVEQGESDAPVLPAAIDAKSTAEWTRQALAGGQPVPEPLVQQLACCCYAAGRTEDFSQALALASELVRPVAQAH